jgi:NADPH:quinone reductase-like Zn-dependent oxidoreductase
VILGADVTATGRAGQGDFVRSLGASTFTEDAGDLRDGFDVVVDTVGGPVLEASYGLTRRGGRLVTLSAPPSAQRAEQLGIHAMTFVVTPDAAQLLPGAEDHHEGCVRDADVGVRESPAAGVAAGLWW